jgi:hypothetical protein
MSERTRRERAVIAHGIPYIRLGSGRLASFWDMVDAAERAQTDLYRAVTRAFKIAEAQPDPSARVGDVERVEWLVDSVDDWVRAMRAALAKQRSTEDERDRIARLRNTAGRTSAEAAMYRRKADELEARLVTAGADV